MLAWGSILEMQLTRCGDVGSSPKPQGRLKPKPPAPEKTNEEKRKGRKAADRAKAKKHEEIARREKQEQTRETHNKAGLKNWLGRS